MLYIATAAVVIAVAAVDATTTMVTTAESPITMYQCISFVLSTAVGSRVLQRLRTGSAAAAAVAACFF